MESRQLFIAALTSTCHTEHIDQEKNSLGESHALHRCPGQKANE